MKRAPVHTKGETVILIKVKSWIEFAHMLLVCIHGYLKSVMRYKIVILVTCLPGHYLHKLRWEGPWFCLEVKKFPLIKKFVKH